MGLHSNPFTKSSLSYFYTIGHIIGQNRAAAHNKIKTKNPPSKFVPNSWIWDGDTPLERPDSKVIGFKNEIAQSEFPHMTVVSICIKLPPLFYLHENITFSLKQSNIGAIPWKSIG